MHFGKNLTKNVIKHPWLTIAVWLILVIISSNGAVLLHDQISNERTFTESPTESQQGFDIINANFNITTTGTSLIVVVDNPGQNFSTMGSEWFNFLLYYTLYLNSSFYPEGFENVASYSLLMMAGQTSYASGLLSADSETALINIASSTISGEDHLDDAEHYRSMARDTAALLSYLQVIRTYPPIPQTGNLPSNSSISALFAASNGNTPGGVYLTGEIPQFHDILQSSKDAFDSSETVAIIIVVIVLILVFRSPIGVAIPLIALPGALFTAYYGTALVAKSGAITISEFIPSIIAMIGIAVAVDYNLFSIVRYREEFRKRKAEHLLNGTWGKATVKEVQKQAAKVMVNTSGQAVIYSGMTVIIGFSALLIASSSMTLSMAVGVSIVVFMSILTANTLTPALLSLFGAHLDWPNQLTRASHDVRKITDEKQHRKVKQTFWQRQAHLVMKYPWTFLIISLLILAPFIYLSTDMHMGFDSVKNIPRGYESRTGLDLINSKFDLGALTPYQVVIDTQAIGGALDGKLLNTTADYARWALAINEKGDSGLLTIHSVRSINVVTNQTTGTIMQTSNAVVFGMSTNPAFRAATSDMVNYDYGNTTLVIMLTSNLDYGSNDAWDLAGILRDKAHEMFDDYGNVYLTGFAALLKDSATDLYADVPLMLTVASVLIFLALLLLFRSIILPLKAIITISGSILFGLGTLVYVFQEGHFLTLLDAERVSIPFFIPLFLFTTILGLGMDYSIFIINRIKEENMRMEREGVPEKARNMAAVGIGLSKTAGVITSAATVMIATFMVFALAKMIILKTMGLAMAVAIFIDATITRTVILPAAMRLAGKWNWWIPKWLDRILPKIEFEH